jgi:hypothetical protein
VEGDTPIVRVMTRRTIIRSIVFVAWAAVVGYLIVWPNGSQEMHNKANPPAVSPVRPEFTS